MRIEVICTGDEILSGKTVNTNFSHISRRLQEVGLPVAWETTVGDDKAELVRAVVLSVDEKSQIQALDRTQPGLRSRRAGSAP